MMQTALKPPSGAGLGLRRGFLTEFIRLLTSTFNDPSPHDPSIVLPDFVEVAPENWIGIGGAFADKFAQIANRLPVVAHGLSLNLGGTDKIDQQHVSHVGEFLNHYQVSIYSEHLSASAVNGHLYDLMPLAFNAECVQHISARIRQVQDQLGRRIAVENSSYYCSLANDLSELDFIKAVLIEADCELLLDVNNVYVNGFNHGYSPAQFIDALPAERVRYLHVAGHHQESADLIIDTHGSDVGANVWSLLEHTRKTIGVRPALLERDFDFPPLKQLLAETQQLKRFLQ
jgi:uncharacterized protein